MDLRVVATEKAPKAIGPYSQAIIAGGLVLRRIGRQEVGLERDLAAVLQAADKRAPALGGHIGGLDGIAGDARTRDRLDAHNGDEVFGRCAVALLQFSASTDVSTVEEEELSALMGEKEDYNQADEQPEEDWED